MGFKKKLCACGCGRVGEFSKYATSACRQRAYRKRKNDFIDIKAKAVSSWLVDMFSEDEMKPIFDDLNKISGNQNVKHCDDALEKLVYLMNHKLTAANKKNRRI